MAPTSPKAPSPGEEPVTGQPCRWCGKVFLVANGPGRPRRYCSQSCRQQHYIERRTAVSAGRDPDRIVVDRATFEQFESLRLQLSLALDDVERTSGSAEPSTTADWVIEHARALVAIDLTQQR